jgi:hypothetical protein
LIAMSTVEDNIKPLLARILRVGGFGRIEIAPDAPLPATTGMTPYRPTKAEQREEDLSKLLSKLAEQYEYTPGRDQLELSYENGALVMVRIVFPA